MLFGMVVMPLDSFTFSICVVACSVLVNAPLPTDVTLSGMLTSVSGAFWNAVFPMVFRVSGNSTAFTPCFTSEVFVSTTAENAKFPMLSSFAGSFTESGAYTVPSAVVYPKVPTP